MEGHKVLSCSCPGARVGFESDLCHDIPAQSVRGSSAGCLENVLAALFWAVRGLSCLRLCSAREITGMNTESGSC
jgi:hypothetical protein